MNEELKKILSQLENELNNEKEKNQNLKTQKDDLQMELDTIMKNNKELENKNKIFAEKINLQ